MARSGCRALVSSSSSMVEPLVKWMAAEQTVMRNWAFSSSSSVLHSSRFFHAKREKKHVDRVSAAVEAVHERKLPPELRGKSKDAVRSETEILNVVEQRIWHSMEEGQFENLPGKGKPLNYSANPHADPAEDTLFRILSKNGCAPEWVELNKEIRSKIKEWRAALKKAWATRSNEDDPKWIEFSDVLKVQMHDINNKVFRYNLIVPFGRQMFGLKWEKEISQVEG
ncbi:hypothetical protein H6P81_017593 [Aristolochia fimbriata]|uniref:DnaJ homologue subfamily C member 28 conserved domain-containing protein n=1 Tax=Aristolochia fimbriata TaxID=158543 RepID=A0AAV7DYV0_ARIFI|nr:hypothetical protein H6P81_017593 [Aristolochia fimbriata]